MPKRGAAVPAKPTCGARFPTLRAGDRNFRHARGNCRGRGSRHCPVRQVRLFHHTERFSSDLCFLKAAATAARTGSPPEAGSLKRGLLAHAQGAACLGAPRVACPPGACPAGGSCPCVSSCKRCECGKRRSLPPSLAHRGKPLYPHGSRGEVRFNPRADVAAPRRTPRAARRRRSADVRYRFAIARWAGCDTGKRACPPVA